MRNKEVLVQIGRQAVTSPSPLLLPNEPEKGDWINCTGFPQSDHFSEGQEQYSSELLQKSSGLNTSDQKVTPEPPVAIGLTFLK